MKNWLTGKDPDAGKDWRQEDKEMAEDEMVGWHHRLNGHEFEEATGVVMESEAWRAAIRGVTKSRTRLGDWIEGLNYNKNEFVTIIYTCFSYISTTDFKENPDNIHG